VIYAIMVQLRQFCPRVFLPYYILGVLWSSRNNAWFILSSAGTKKTCSWSKGRACFVEGRTSHGITRLLHTTANSIFSRPRTGSRSNTIGLGLQHSRRTIGTTTRSLSIREQTPLVDTRVTLTLIWSYRSAMASSIEAGQGRGCKNNSYICLRKSMNF